MIKYSKHARQRMVERGITVTEVEEAIKKGMKELQKPDKVLYHFGYFTVAAKKVKGNHYVITVKPRW